MRYSIKIEKEINLLASLIYSKLDQDGHWRAKIFFTEDLMESFKTTRVVIYRQLRYLANHGYISYTSPKENRAGKIKTLQTLEYDGTINEEAFISLDKFKTNKVKVLSAMHTLKECSTNEVKYLIEDTSRATVSRLLLMLEREGIIESLVETYKGSNIENKWRLV